MTKEELDAFFTTGISGTVTSLVIRVLVILLIFIVGSKLIKIVLSLVQKSMEKMNAEENATMSAKTFPSSLTILKMAWKNLRTTK